MRSGGAENETPGPTDKPLLAVTTGDPCGIGPEVVLKAVSDERAATAARLLVLGDEQHLRRTARELKLKWPFAAVSPEPPGGRRWERPQLLDLAHVHQGLVPGQISVHSGRAAAVAVERAVQLAMDGLADAVVTAPLQKEALALAGYTDPGHTELLARLTGAKQVGMMFWSEQFSVGLLSTHLSLRDALKKVRTGLVYRKLRLFDREWRRFLGSAPRIGVAALNPHGSEGGRFGVEEAKYLAPAVEKARAQGVKVDGPFPADSIFVRARRGEFDLVLALYHDQATIPIKLLYAGKAVNVTVGLPFVRTSVDHGTAMDIAGRGVASEEGMVQAILAAVRFVKGAAAGRAAP
ncbi:MAG: 4-hydroxythreonine-4-phosphate dehydrogenase PdxA [Acidobacteria bacterium]|nr:MAG: 4-hydroxythreonine-4-phosphate dehydrogenase PdxA [Acidobacteriota bacterium]